MHGCIMVCAPTLNDVQVVKVGQKELSFLRSEGCVGNGRKHMEKCHHLPKHRHYYNYFYHPFYVGNEKS
jgi:hypothetical protein